MLFKVFSWRAELKHMKHKTSRLAAEFAFPSDDLPSGVGADRLPEPRGGRSLLPRQSARRPLHRLQPVTAQLPRRQVLQQGECSTALWSHYRRITSFQGRSENWGVDADVTHSIWPQIKEVLLSLSSFYCMIWNHVSTIAIWWRRWWMD